jgi:ribosomal protein S18 acetylase RimI-like enzyme
VNIETRPATTADLPLLYDLNKSAMQEQIIENIGYWNEEDQLRDFSETTDLSLHKILMHGDVAVGFMNVQPREHGVHLNRLCIIPNYQGRGIGTTLISELVRHSSSEAPVTLQVFPRSPALRLYCRLGFEQIKATATHIHMRHTSNGSK